MPSTQDQSFHFESNTRNKETIKKDLLAVYRFIFSSIPNISFFVKLYIIFRFMLISSRVKCSHTMEEILEISKAFLKIPSTVSGVFVEAGSYKGGSTAKLSLIAKLAKRKLVVFDSFDGLPESNDMYTSRDGLFFRDKKSFRQTKKVYFFDKGQYAGSLKEVKENITSYGEIETCEFKKGWFEETLPKFHKNIAGVFIDVDLKSSTRTCLKYLYPLLQSNGMLFSHDGHLDLATAVYADRKFWKEQVDTSRPVVNGMKTNRLLSINKT